MPSYMSILVGCYPLIVAPIDDILLRRFGLSNLDSRTVAHDEVIQQGLLTSAGDRCSSPPLWIEDPTSFSIDSCRVSKRRVRDVTSFRTSARGVNLRIVALARDNALHRTSLIRLGTSARIAIRELAARTIVGHSVAPTYRATLLINMAQDITSTELSNDPVETIARLIDLLDMITLTETV